MHTFELRRRIQILFSESDSYRPFTTALTELAKSAEALEAILPGLAKGGDRLNHWATQVHSHLASVQRTTSTNNHRQFYKALEHFQRTLWQLEPFDLPSVQLISALSAKIEEFAALYDAFLSTPSGEHALPLLLAAKVLHAKLGTLFDTLHLFEETVGEYDIPGNAEGPFALHLPAHLDVAEFARRLTAIQSLYSELCMLLSVSESTYPLRISKIESGSLWAKLFGESRVVELMASFVEQTASWLFRTYTAEGKIASVPRKVEAIDSLLRLSERLDEAGVNTSEMKEHIEKSAVAISKSLSDLLGGQSSVTVNEQTISIASEVNKGLLEQITPLKLLNSDSISVGMTPTLPPVDQ